MDICDEINTNKCIIESCEAGEKYGLANKCKKIEKDIKRDTEIKY
jgi:hypothetical protein